MKKEDVARQIDEMLEEFKKSAYQKLDKAHNSGAVPEEWKEDDGNYCLAKAILDSLCKDRPYEPTASQKKDFNNLHLFM